MDANTFSKIGDFIRSLDVSIEDVHVGDNMDLITFQKDERSEWYNGSHKWHYIDDVTILVRRNDFNNSISYGWQNAQRESEDQVWIWIN